MKKVVPILLVCISCMPAVVGMEMHLWMMHNLESAPPYAWIGVLFLLAWALIAFLAKCFIKNTKSVMVFLHFVPMVNLILLGVQELCLQRYWIGNIGTWTQFFYMPVLYMSFPFIFVCHSLFSSYCMCFLLMVLVAFLGCKLKR